jgi:subtilase family serine protease
VLESLETRQLLSVASVGLNQIVAQPSVAAMPTPLLSSLYPSGLSPTQVRQAYGINQVTFQNGKITGNGSGQTIALVVAYDDPNIGSDLTQFDRQYGLANPPSFTKYVETGLSQSNPGWSLETSLDVEWSHAMAPGANLVLVEARSASFSDLFNAVNFARSLSGVVAVSMSWGSGEFYGETAYDSLFTTPAGHIGGDGLQGGVTFVAASGDSGAWSGVSYPAASPNVLSVGATTLYLGAGSSYAGELGWTDSTGGFSALEPAPAYQINAQYASGLDYGLRTQPDVAAVGDPATGVSVYDTVRYGGQSGWFSVGGTSAAAPQWAGLIAVADQGLGLAGIGSLRNTQAALYALPSSSFHDVTSGFNGYSAKSGYDLVTGLGTPVANRVVAGLLATQGVYNVTGFTSPHVPGALGGLTAQPRLDLTSNSSTGAASGSAGSTTIFPVPFPTNIVVVVVSIGSSSLVVIVPITIPSHPLFASNSHPVQPETPSPVSLPAPTPSTLNSFGQISTVDSLSWWRTSRFGSEPEVAALIDVVEPFQAPVPAIAPNKAATRSRTEATVMLPAVGLPLLPRPDHGEEGARRLGADLSCPNPPAALLPEVSREDESPTASLAPRLAFAAALAGAGYWLTLRDFKGRKPGWDVPRSDRALRPRVRPWSLVPR